MAAAQVAAEAVMDWVSLLTTKELYVAQVERGRDGVVHAGVVLPWSEEEEEIDPGEVYDSLVSWGATFGD